MPFIHLLVGLPAVGKSTWLNLHVGRRTIPYNIVSTDSLIEDYALRVGKNYDEVFKEYIETATNIYNSMLTAYLSGGANIIVDRTNLTRGSRSKILKMVPPGYKKTAIVFNCSWKNQEERLAQRKGKHIPDNVIKSMWRNYEDPTLSEGFDDITHIDTDLSIRELAEMDV